MSRKKGLMDTALAKHLISEARKSGFCRNVTTNVMGEPLLHKGLFEIVEHAHTVGQRLTVITNGERLDADTAEKLIAAKPFEVAISFHADSDASFAARGAAISYSAYKNQVFQLLDVKYRLRSPTRISVQVMTSVTRPASAVKLLAGDDDIREFGKEWLSFAREMKKKHALNWQVPPRIFVGANGLLPGFYLALYDSYHTWSNSILPPGTAVKKGVCCHCTAPFTQCNVLWNGDMTLCCIDYDGELVFENVKDKPLVETFNSLQARALRARFIDGKGVPEKCLLCWGSLEPVAAAASGCQKAAGYRLAPAEQAAKAYYRTAAIIGNGEVLDFLSAKLRTWSTARKMRSRSLEP